MASADLIDVKQRIAQYSLEELNGTAEAYFARLDNWDYLLAKPLAQIGEAPELLQCFAHVVDGLNLAPDMTVLDFGAGACWTSRFLTQLGLQVIALDVSQSALHIGEALYARNPVVGDQPNVRFLHFDGLRIDLPNASVDRISCWEAFHHVPNTAHVLKEMMRVLKPGGIAGFSEPGPTHSRAPQSQAEMRNHRVIENDVVVEDVWRDAQAAGFADVRIAAFAATAPLYSLEEFGRLVEGRGEQESQRLVEAVRGYLAGRRLFFLYKPGPAEQSDSRRREGLEARLSVTLARGATPDRLRVQGRIVNSGTATWLGRSARVGAVHVGVHLYDSTHVLKAHGYHVHYGLGGTDPDAPIPPGGVCHVDFEMPAPPPGGYVFEIDLVSAGIAWFAECGTLPARISATVPVW
jgi:ubiquinone/menaquinone biosynthesis C-methylase UbiE